MEQEAELQGSSWDGAFLVTLTTCASNQAPMFVSRASTYSLTCEEKGNSLIRPQEGNLIGSTDKGLVWFLALDARPGMQTQMPATGFSAAGLWTFGSLSVRDSPGHY